MYYTIINFYFYYFIKNKDENYILYDKYKTTITKRINLKNIFSKLIENNEFYYNCIADSLYNNFYENYVKQITQLNLKSIYSNETHFYFIHPDETINTINYDIENNKINLFFKNMFLNCDIYYDNLNKVDIYLFYYIYDTLRIIMIKEIKNNKYNNSSYNLEAFYNKYFIYENIK